MNPTENNNSQSQNSPSSESAAPIAPPNPGQSFSPSNPQSNQPTPPAADLPAPHQPADYVPQPEAPIAPGVTTTPPVPSANQMFQPTVPPGPAAINGSVVSGSGGIVTGSGGLEPPTPTVPGTSQMFAPDAQPVPPPNNKSRFKKPLFLALVIALVLGGGASAFYFGYYANPSVVLSQSLSNTGKGYMKLVDYFDQQSKVHYKGTVGKGTYTVKGSGSSTDGNFSYASSDGNSDTKFDIGLGTTRVKADVITIKLANSTAPDVYLNASGITGLGALTGSAQIDNAVNKYDGKWIAIDHTLLNSAGGNLSSLASTPDASTGASNAPSYPSESQVIDELHAFGQVNQQYLFTTDKSRSVTTVVKNHGVETVDGHKAYHYTMALNKDHVKQYLVAQHDALKASKLNDWIKKENAEDQLDQSFKSSEDSTKDIKSSDTFDLWADVNTRLVYKLRFAGSGQNAATNYVDVGLDYKSGTSYPFFISGQSKDSSGTGSGSLVMTLDSKSNSVGVKINGKSSGSSPFNLDANFTFSPTNNVATIKAPSGAVPLTQVLNDFGYGNVLNATPATPATPASSAQSLNNAGIQSSAIGGKSASNLLSGAGKLNLSQANVGGLNTNTLKALTAAILAR